ncbi:GNAT family N-acetyltransferase [Actinoplanes regularis]|uniref:N-acetylglutamate synthase, GNAT family n=1 Tax=Actinoplanes regularis TaxID=52697 RepID=A0A239K5P3_9ACTN|nr:GNAT family N-acetyltransferase [Actinoplanes regularis]GIE92418.1 N-acetyltransferase [Actinoplanes regularis]SNT13280.1 N-acetylglutamate synthase, GNAT family [Actinoplanes regularis]
MDSPIETNPLSVRAATVADETFIRETLSDAFGSTMMAVHDELIDARGAAAAIAERGGRRLGLITYREDQAGGWEIVSLASVEPGAGAGTALLTWLTEQARRSRISRLWLVTTNENVDALRFYQRRGLDLVRLDRDAVLRARKLKPSIPLEENGIPIRHELELELRL